MKNSHKYERLYFMPPTECFDWVKKDFVEKPPIWCSVDLRDGNQALVEPMSLREKIEYFRLLVELGFKHIEVGFPAASETEFQFVRNLIEKDLIPQDVTIQVLTQAREHIIRRTFEAVAGAPRAIIHVYNSTSVAQREQVFRKNKEEIKQIAVEGARLLQDLAAETEGNFTFEYSPESFPGTEVEYALEVCNAVVNVWKPTVEKPCIINLPTTVQIALPHVFASQVEYFHKNLHRREAVILSIHPHNDRGCGISDAELSLLAGAQRIEGTLFGNGERTGNVDLVTLAMNLYAHGIDPGLDFSDINSIRHKYEILTNMHVGPRQPYSGDLVFTAFSGSHQDAIAKGMAHREKNDEQRWTVPYLPIDPMDIGRAYESDVIRINSQSGKGGVSYILKQNYGLNLPEKMREEVGYLVKNISDIHHKELDPAWIYQIFKEHYMDIPMKFTLDRCFYQRENSHMIVESSILKEDGAHKIIGKGNGRLDSVSTAIKSYFGLHYELVTYEEHALSHGSHSHAISYVGIKYKDQIYWGVSENADIVRASVEALVVAVNKVLPST